MTKYRITRYHGESEPCAIADPDGCFYSTGEVDRRIDELLGRISARDKGILEPKQALFDVESPSVGEMRQLLSDMIAWFQWFQPYPSIAVQEFITRGRKFEGRDTDDERTAETVSQGNPRVEG